MDKVRVTTLWDKKAWVADHVLRKAQQNGRGIVVKYKKETMTIPFAKVHPKFWKKGDGQYKDKHTGAPYVLYGIKFVKDKEVQSQLF